MSNKLKLYLVSLLGIRSTFEDDKPKSLFCHVPLMVEATDIVSAAEQACTEARKWFPVHEGFKATDVSVKPVSPEYYLRLSQFGKLQRLAETPDPLEQPLVFRCDTSEADEEGEDVVVEFDRPASW
jgi:hypothetical protein